MADLRSPFPAAGPVVTRMVRGVRKRSAVRLRTRQDIVPLVVVGRPGDHVALFSQCRDLRQAAAEPCLLERIAMEIAKVFRDASSFGVVPWPCSDPIAGVNR